MKIRLQQIRRRSPALTCLSGLLLSACSVTEADPTVYGDGPCSGRGSEHSGALAASETWTATDGPHHVTGTLRIGTQPHEAVLMIGPGSVVCFGPAASLATSDGSLLVAAGTADAPIIFTASSQSDRWSGITINEFTAAHSHISHAVIEYASYGVIGRGPVNIEHTLIRQISGTGIVFWHYNYANGITHTVVDSAGLDGTSPAVYLEGGHLLNTTVSGSGAVGISMTARHAPVRISRCDVHGSRDHGIVVENRTVGTVRINGCNLEDNGGSGINNESAAVADATGNWWGDPDGPLAPGGDGVSPNVDYSPFLVAPRTDPTITMSGLKVPTQ